MLLMGRGGGAAFLILDRKGHSVKAGSLPVWGGGKAGPLQVGALAPQEGLRDGGCGGARTWQQAPDWLGL